tara:strand:+ start:2102 stop:3382 length:1281 start_codon:yes stop_codon:yes gene_type:complete
MNVYIRENTTYYAPIKYVLKLIVRNRNVDLLFVNDANKAEVLWDHENERSEYFNQEFYKNLGSNIKKLKHDNLFNNSVEIKDEKNNTIDLVATIFYLVNCIQEFNPSEEELDEFNRFKYTSSLQYKFKIIEENLVEQLMDGFCNKHQLKSEKRDSRFFISHDIDTIYGSFLQDGFWALKNMKVGVIMNLILFELSRKPHWRNIDRIIKINDEYDVKSTFFWLVNKGKGTQNVKNADYYINREKKLLELVEQSNNTNGLHKSCSTMSIDEELKKGNIKSTYNRYHFLSFKSHENWKTISDSKLNFDCSLGFAEHYGFRNSYGKAFQPFDISTNKPYDFIEAPLHFMDVTFHKYVKYPTQKIGDTIIDFYSKNNKNCDFSLLWHNTYYTNYKYNSFIDEYKKVLSFIYESKIECVSPKNLVQENKLEW